MHLSGGTPSYLQIHESNPAESETGTAPEFSVSWSDYASTTSDHIWTLTDLQVLHELRTPIFVVVPGIVESSHRYATSKSHARDSRAAATSARALFACSPGGLLHTARCVFQNAESLKRFGLPLPAHVFSENLEHLSADDCKIRRDWITRIMLVSEQWPVDACIMLEQLLQYLPLGHADAF